MKLTFPQSTLFSIATALALVGCGSEPAPPAADPPATPQPVEETATSALPLPEGDVVAATLEGHLEQVTAEGVQPFSLAGAKPQFYLLYYTASW